LNGKVSEVSEEEPRAEARRRGGTEEADVKEISEASKCTPVETSETSETSETFETFIFSLYRNHFELLGL
jgi:hypothetical protein